MDARVSALYVYPIKSCGGVSLPFGNVSWGGLRYDRQWMLVDADGRFMTQRDYPRLCLLKTSFTETHLRVRAPFPTEYWSPLDGSCREEEREVEVWGDRVRVFDEGKTAARWFSFVLGVECRFVRAPWDSPRRARGQDVAHILLADQQQFLVVSEASLADLNGRLDAPLPMDRFRPNIVVAGCGPYEEDAWKEIRIGGVHFHGANRCARCAITTVDQSTAERGLEPMKTLATYRRDGKKVVFGRYFNARGGGSLHLGDAVEMIE